MVFERNGYTLYARDQRVRGGRHQTVFFFSKRKPIAGKPVDPPEGYLVVVEKSSGIPYLKKK